MVRLEAWRLPCDVATVKCLFVQWLVLTLMCLQTMWSWVLQVFTEARSVRACVCISVCACACVSVYVPNLWATPHVLFLDHA